MTRNVKRATVAAIVFILLFATACSNNAPSHNEPGTNKPADSGTNTQQTGPTVEPGPLGKYDPPIEITTVRAENAKDSLNDQNSYEDNVWTRGLAQDLGINIKNKWISSNVQYPNRVTVTMVSGDMPDFMEVNMQQFQQLAQAGQLADLSEIFDTYASDLVKEYYSEAAGMKLKAGTVNGKLLGLALDGGGRDDSHLLYIRNDWLRNIGREAPKTMDELIDLAIAFTKEDPNRSGKNDTYGLGGMKDIFGGWAGFDGFFNGYGAYPFNPANGAGTNLIFLKDANGKAIWADTQPEVKTALEKLAMLFKEGAIHPEFSVNDGGRVGDHATSGQVGMVYGAFWVPTWPINNMKKDNPEVDWGVYEIPSLDGSPSTVKSTGMPSRFVVVKKDSNHPEAMVKIMNYVAEKLRGDNEDRSFHMQTIGDTTYQLHMLAPVRAGSAERNQNNHYRIVEALDAGDSSMLDHEQKSTYDQIIAYRDGDNAMWTWAALFDRGGVFEKLGNYKQQNRIIMTAYTGAPTPTMLSRGAALRDAQIQTFTQIIMGAKPVEAFDEWVEQWHNQGGQDILNEINETGQVQ